MTTTTSSRRQWLWEHIGRLTGLLLGLVALAFVVLLASLGWAPAYGILVVLVVGVALIALGGRMHGR
jgi:hypothetical protein